MKLTIDNNFFSVMNSLVMILLIFENFAVTIHLHWNKVFDRVAQYDCREDYFVMAHNNYYIHSWQNSPDGNHIAVYFHLGSERLELIVEKLNFTVEKFAHRTQSYEIKFEEGLGQNLFFPISCFIRNVLLFWKQFIASLAMHASMKSICNICSMFMFTKR